MNHADFAPARDALDRAHADGRRIDVWLRDDDCVAVTPALERLASLCGDVGLPILLAVIPAPAEDALAPWVAAHPAAVPCQHGFRHANHAPAGERARELGGRAVEAVLGELAQGREKLKALFGDALSGVLVPPWNRIDAALIPHLPGAGYAALSCFAPTPDASPLPRLDSDLDIVDWRGGRVGRPPGDLARKVAGVVAGGDRLGVLTHHLAHDGAAWAGLEALLDVLAAHPAVRFTSAGALLQGSA
ncbi:polysaccharide deacetylase family protein [Lichenibacterium dinghuense]|uniref:polysaccharide deacetylase family protein n=1 Tax=Lichenibacterium dinghuense TaxID=2895977 RepID=UPI001F484405|nr:polysaccharide deacetylase family protein [Lichenibacterium sp. 6Y81]